MHFSTKKLATLSGHRASVFAVVPGAEPHTVLSGAGDGWIVKWSLDDPDTGKLLAKVDTNIFALHYITSTQTLLIGDMHGGVHWVKPHDPSATLDVAHHKKGVFAIIEMGEYVLTLGGDGLLTRWSIAKQRTIDSLQLSHQSLRSIAYAPDRNELAIGASDENIYLLDAKTLELKYTIAKAHEHSVFTVQYTPDEQHLLSGGRDAHLRVWNRSNPTIPVFAEAAHWFTINAIQIHPKGHIFATASRDKTIRIWNMVDFSLLKSLDHQRYQGHVNSVNDLYWSPYRDTLVSASDDRQLIVWGFEETL